MSLSKKNIQERLRKEATSQEHYALRKLSVGVASVLLGTTFFIHGQSVQADTTTSTNQPTTVGTTTADTSGSQAGTVALRNSSAANKSTNQGTVAGVNTTNPGTTSATTSVADAEATPSAPDATGATTNDASAATTTSPDPTTPNKSTDTAILNNSAYLTNDWMQFQAGKTKVYFTVKGLDGKVYVSSYADFQHRVDSLFFNNRFDPNSLELHVEFQSTDGKLPLVYVSWGTDMLQIDTSRVGADGLTYVTDTGAKQTYTLGVGGNYKNYNDWIKAGQDLTKLDRLYLNSATDKDKNLSLVVPLKYVGSTDGAEHTTQVLITDYNAWKSANMQLKFQELHPAQIDTPAKPTTDDATLTTGIYNNPLATASDWLKTTHGEVIAYYTAKGKDGKTYVTSYVTAQGKSQSIINVEQIDLNTLEYHLIYHNGDENVNSGIWANFADGKTLAIDTSRIGADGIQLKSQQGYSYSWAMNGIGDGGSYWTGWDAYLKAHNGLGDKATQISLTGVKIAPDDTVEMVIPVKYIGQLTDRQQALGFTPNVDDYGKGFTRNSASLYFTTVRKDLSTVKKVILKPAEFVKEATGEFDWVFVDSIMPDMPNGWDVLKVTNFPTYKGSFNPDSLPTGKLPQVVYGTAQYFIDLSQIQQIYANHGYTVKYANNNGKSEEMPFYTYVTLPLAKFIDGHPINDPSIWAIQVQAVPALILNHDQHYMADPNAKPWDTTSMVDAVYGADDPGARKSRQELTQLDKTDVNITYTYQAPGSTTIAAANKVDLTKAGVYTVTYSHTYADGRVVKDSRKVYVDDTRQETKDVTRTIIVYTPTGTQTVVQKATVSRSFKVDAATGDETLLTDWSTADWPAYTAPSIAGYTPDLAAVDPMTVTHDTADTTVEIHYSKNADSNQGNHNNGGQTGQQTDNQVSGQTGQQVGNQVQGSQSTGKAANNRLPQTGNHNQAALLGFGMATTLGMFGLAGRRRHKD